MKISGSVLIALLFASGCRSTANRESAVKDAPTAPTEAASTEEVSIQGRLLRYDCGQENEQTIEATVVFNDIEHLVQDGATVDLRFGFGGLRPGSNQSFDWSEQSDATMDQSGENKFSAIIDKRWPIDSVDGLKSTLQFAIRVTQPDGNTVWRRGSDSAFGFFEADYKDDSYCVAGGALPRPRPLPIRKVRR